MTASVITSAGVQWLPGCTWTRWSLKEIPCLTRRGVYQNNFWVLLCIRRNENNDISRISDRVYCYCPYLFRFDAACRGLSLLAVTCQNLPCFGVVAGVMKQVLSPRVWTFWSKSCPRERRHYKVSPVPGRERGRYEASLVPKSMVAMNQLLSPLVWMLQALSARVWASSSKSYPRERA